MSKIFPFTGGEVPRQKIVSQSEHVSSQIWCQKFFPLLRPGTPPLKIWDQWPPQKIWDWGPPQKSETRDPPKKSETGTPRKIWDQVPPQKSEIWDPPPIHGWIRYPSHYLDLDLDLGPPPPPRRGVDWHTKWKYNLSHPSDAGGKKSWQHYVRFALEYIFLFVHPNTRREKHKLLNRKIQTAKFSLHNLFPAKYITGNIR